MHSTFMKPYSQDLPNSSEFSCPSCSNRSRFCVAVVAWAGMFFDEDGSLISTDTEADDRPDGLHEWANDSNMVCAACGHQGPVASFKIESQTVGASDGVGAEKVG